ncbi:LysR family transcriptional regulator [Microbacterium sp. SLBN-146]|uniref:LysR family transcriptional regulator n=1 Tax=Microbacterium sp. SLBN-146 TaxID=2768457 RepID=UPI001151CD43|nr:LysR substrate-binding domain-containing protein [Microbacterium sp. SLBN-146]TQJ31145.1 DNA-binding transcriptional LysR family regulator [Microbacterium sp. SLBN-146]
MSISRLRYFVAIAQERSFVRAAARLHVTQSALSQQLRRLEEEIGRPLVVRTPRAVTLTDAGRALLPEARDIVRRYDHLPRVAEDAARRASEVIRLGAVPSALIGLVPALSADFHAEMPEAELVVEEVWTPEQIDRLRAGTLDVGIFRSLYDPDGFDSIDLDPDDYCVCLPESHPLARAATVAWSDLRGEKIVLPRRDIGHAEFDAVVAACHTAGFAPDMLPVTVLGFHFAAWVAAGSGVAILPAYATRQRQAGTVVRALEPRIPTIPLRMAMPRMGSTPAGRALAALATRLSPPRPL